MAAARGTRLLEISRIGSDVQESDEHHANDSPSRSQMQKTADVMIWQI
jgi:hypothetical protein